MRRTDEAFKQEVLRRYGVQAKNRRNLRILALSPLIFCVFIAAVLWLPSLLNHWSPAPVADTPETTTTTVEDTPPEDTPPEDALKLGTLIPEPSMITAMRFRDDRYANTMLTTEDPHDIQMILPLLSEIVVKQVSDSTEMVIMGYDFTFSVSSGEEISVKIDSDSPYLFIYHARTETVEFYKASITEFQSVIAAAHQLEEKLLAITPDPEEYLPDPKGTVYLSYPWQQIQLSSPDALELITFLHEKLDGLPLVIRDKIIVDRYSVSSSNMSLYFDFDNNLITVDIIRSDYIDFYNFSIPKEDMTELFDRIQTLINQANPPVTPPDVSQYIPENYTEVWVYNGTSGHRRSPAYTIPLLETLREKLASARISYAPIQHLESYRIEIEAEGMRSDLVLDLDSNLITVNIQEDPNDYYFSLSEADMADILVAINNFIEEKNPKPVTPPDPPKPPESADLPTTLEECLKHTVKKVTVTIGTVGKTPTYTYTDKESIDTLLSLITEQKLVPSASQDFPDYPDGLHLQYWINDQGKEKSYFTILFDSSGKFECSVYDGKTYHETVYDLPVDTIAAITEAAKPYYDPPPSDQTPLIKDLSGNKTLQAFLEAVGVTVHETPQDVPQEIKTILTDYSYSSPSIGLFACDQAYTSPDEISLYALLYNYHNGHYLTDGERVALVQAGVHPDAVENIDYGIFTKEEVRKLLADYLAYMPAFADDLHGALVKAGFVYLPETGRFYYFHGDTNTTGPAENIRVYHTDRADTVIALYSYYTSPTALAVVAFRNTADGYKVLGYTPLDPL